MSMRIRSPRLVRCALAIGAPLLALGLVEAGFRVAGFTYAPTPMDLLFTGGDSLTNASVADDDVFWTLKPSHRFRFAGLEIVTNELGTRDPLPPREKSPGTLRIVCLGDSTAFGGHTTYPAQLEQILRECAPDTHVEVINAGVPGWTTIQGVRLFQRDLVAWRPDIVTASFGFNNAKRERDGLTDRQRIAARETSALRLPHWAKRSRFVQWLQKQRDARRATAAPSNSDRERLQLRVPPADLARSLEDLNASCRSIGAKLLLVSQPHGFTWKEGDRVGDLTPAAIDDVRGRLDEQNATVARTAAELAVPFVDVAAEFRTLHPGDVYVDPLPGKDPLHTSAYGARRVADALADALFEAQWIPGTRRSPTRPFRSCGPIAALDADLDGDGKDEIALAVVADGATHVRMFDPRSHETRALGGPLPAADGGFELAQVPLLSNALLLSVLARDGHENRLYVVDDAGSVKPFGKGAMRAQKDALFQVLPVDLTGDDRVEYAVCATGLGGAPWVLFLSADGQQVVSRSAQHQDWSGGVRLCGVDAGMTDGRSAVALTPSLGPTFVLMASIDGRVETFLSPRRIGRLAPSELVAGRFRADGARSLMLVNTPLLTEVRREFLGGANFPFGSAEFDLTAARPVLARVVRDGRSMVVLGVRTGERIVLYRVDEGGPSELLTLDLPAAG